MIEVNFYNSVEDNLLKFAIVVSKCQGEWVLCKHRERDTYELPGGHRDDGEDILAAAKRELFEETGAVEYSIKPMCVYSVFGKDGVVDNKTEIFGMLYYADITKFEEMPSYEMEKVELFNILPNNWTYPQIHPILLQKAENIIGI